jgi:hypothetical protein
MNQQQNKPQDDTGKAITTLGCILGAGTVALLNSEGKIPVGGAIGGGLGATVGLGINALWKKWRGHK